MADQITIKDEIYNSSPSTAFINKKGEYVACPVNQPLAKQQAEGKCGAQPIGNHVHPISHAGYCEAHKSLGCTDRACN